MHWHLNLQPHCRTTKSTLKQAVQSGAPEALIIDLDTSSDFDESETQDYLASITGARSVPRIFMWALPGIESCDCS